uniref:Rho-elapitoxin-Da1b n=1 Tax=Dendroaspis angusticeps TaxID=8618 RepID=3SI1B_DENAN|nr:RecName: Full=Rho-elapitoxin-Da1b; Short=Rho-Da1b; Short=Rho-EPTX-Da1b [Dendroaspis angusticeps]
LTCVTKDTIFGITTQNCPAGQNLCFIRRHYINHRYTEITRGCTATCPKPTNVRETIHCCNTDKCNE